MSHLIADLTAGSDWSDGLQAAVDVACCQPGDAYAHTQGSAHELTNVAWSDGRRRKLGPEACGLDLKELMVVGEAPEPVMAQTAERQG